MDPISIASSAFSLAQKCFLQYRQWASNCGVADDLGSRFSLLQDRLGRIMKQPELARRNKDSLVRVHSVLTDGVTLISEVVGGKVNAKNVSFVSRMVSGARSFLRANTYRDQFDELRALLDSALGDLQLGLTVDVASDLLGLRDEAAASQTILSQLRDVTDASQADIAAVGSHVAGIEVMLNSLSIQLAAATGSRSGADAALMSSLLDALKRASNSAPATATSHTLSPDLAAVLSKISSAVEAQTATVAALAAKVDAVAASGVPGKVPSAALAPPACPEFTLACFEGSLPRDLALRAAATSGLHESDAKSPSVLGSGSFGTVFLAALYGGTVPVAVKILKGSAHILHDAKALSRVSDEAAFQYSLRLHPNVVTVHGVLRDEEAGVLGIVMERCACSLEEVLYGARKSHSGAFGLATKLDIMLQVTCGLSALHSRTPPLIHADIKAANVLIVGQLGTPGSVKIADFGFARVAQAVGAVDLVESSRGRQGTPLWRAPELFGGRRTAGTPDTLSDLYSLGVLFWEVLTRSAPFSAEHFESLDDVKEVVKDEGKRPDSAGCASPEAVKVFNWTPVQLQTLVRSLWAADRGARPASAAAVSSVLCEAIQMVAPSGGEGRTSGSVFLAAGAGTSSAEDPTFRTGGTASSGTGSAGGKVNPTVTQSSAPVTPVPATESIAAIVARLESHVGDAGVAQSCCEALSTRTEPESGQKQAITARAIAALVAALKAHVRDPLITQAACAAVRNIARTADGQLAARDAPSAIVPVIRLHSHDAPVVLHACEAIVNITLSEAGRKPAIDAGTAAAAVSVLHAHESNATVWSKASSVIWNISLSDPGREASVAAGAPAALVSGVKKFPSDLAFQENALGSLWNVAGTTSGQQAAIDAGAPAVVLDTFRRHPGSAQIAQFACGLVRNVCLLPAGQEMCCSLGSPVLCVEALKSFKGNASVATEACASLTNSALAKGGQDAVVAAGAVPAVMQVLESLPDDSVILQKALNVLWTCTLADAGKAAAFKVGVVQKALVPLVRFPTDAGIAQRVGAIYWNLSGTADGQNALIDAGVPAAAVAAIRSNAGDPIVAQKMCAVFWNVAAASRGQHAVVSARAPEAVVAALVKHADDAVVAQNECAALWNIAAGMPEGLQAIVTAGGPEAVLRVLKAHSSDEAVQKYGSGVLKTLATQASGKSAILKAGGGSYV